MPLHYVYDLQKQPCGILIQPWVSFFHIKYCQLGLKCVPDARWFYEVIPLGSLGWGWLDVSWLQLLERFLSLMATARAGERSSWRVCWAPWQVVLGRGRPSKLQQVLQVLWVVLSPPMAKFLIVTTTPSLACLEKAMWLPCHPAVHSASDVCGDILIHRVGAFVFSVRVVPSLVDPDTYLFGIEIEDQRTDTLSNKNREEGKRRKRRRRSKKRKLDLNWNVLFWRLKYLLRSSVL